MVRNFLTNRHKRYWQKRKIDWEQAYFMDHPHRDLIVKALKNISFGSILEIGCASGYNLFKIRENFPRIQIGGIDISEDAIKKAKELIPDADVLEVSSADNLFLSDKSADILLTDMALIYLSPFDINKAIKELKRVARNQIMLVEFHHKNWFKRQVLRLLAGYNAYDYRKLLEKNGFYEIEIYKLTEADWPGGQPQKEYACLITAKV